MDDEDVVSEAAVEFPLLLLLFIDLLELSIELLELLLIEPPALLLFNEPLLESKEASNEDNLSLMVSVMELKLRSIPEEVVVVVVLGTTLSIAVLALALAATVVLLVVL